MESPSLDFLLYIQRLQTRSQIIDKLDSELDLIYSQLTKPVEPTNAIPGCERNRRPKAAHRTLTPCMVSY